MINHANLKANTYDLADIPDPLDVLEAASKHSTPQSRFWNNPYARASVEGYDHVRFPQKFTQLLEVMLIDLAQERRWKGKKTSKDFLLQEAIRLGKLLKDKGVPHDVSGWWRTFGKNVKPEDFDNNLCSLSSSG